MRVSRSVFSMEEDLTNFLRRRGIPEEAIQRMNDDKFDKYVIQVAEDSTLGQYLPTSGDRLAVKNFCQRNTPGEETNRNNDRKNAILDSLRSKLKLKRSTVFKCLSDSDEGDSACPTALKSKYRFGNQFAKRNTRKIEIGLLLFESETGSFRQIRNKQGGGTRKVDIQKDARMNDVVDLAKNLFFPGGSSALGPLHDFQFELRDFSQEKYVSDETVGDMYQRTGMNILRYYLTALKQIDVVSEKHALQQRPQNETKNLPESSHNNSVISSASGLRATAAASTSYEKDQDLPDLNSSFLSNVLNCSEDEVFFNFARHDKSLDTTNNLAAQKKHQPTIAQTAGGMLSPIKNVGNFTSIYSAFPSTSEEENNTYISMVGQIPTNTIPNSVSGTPDTFTSTGPPLSNSSVNESVTVPTRNEHGIAIPQAHTSTLASRMHFTDSIVLPTAPSQITDAPFPTSASGQHIIVPATSATNAIAETTTHPDSQVGQQNESSSDTNPSFEITVHRGPLSFHELLSQFKDPDIANKYLTVVRILPNGEREQGEDTGGVLRDLLTEFWSDFYAKCTVGRDVKVPCLRHDFGQEEWQSVARILVYGWENAGYWPVKLSNSFVSHCISRDVVRPDVLLEDYFGYVALQDKDVFQAALEEFEKVDTEDLLDALDAHDCKTTANRDNLKPVLQQMAHKEIIQMPMFVANCWGDVVPPGKISSTKLSAVYASLALTNKKVVHMLHFPDTMSAAESEVTRYLKRYVRELDSSKLGCFLRYCTGSDLITVPKITVEFAEMSGLSRRPIAHTCGCVLMIARQYENFMEIRSDFDSILASNIWVMDIV